MLTHNEELLLEQNLLILKEIIPQFAFVDQSSTDRTVSIIRDVLGSRATVNIQSEDYIREIGFSGARNMVSDLCTLPWLLHVDADEAVSILGDHKKIYSDIADAASNYMSVQRNNLHRSADMEFPLTNDKIATLSIESQEEHIRLYRNNVGIRWRSFIHEELWQSGDRLPHGAPICNILLNHLSRFKDFETQERKEEFYGWMITRGYDKPRNEEEELSAYSRHVIKEREDYFRKMACQYEGKLR